MTRVKKKNTPNNPFDDRFGLPPAECIPLLLRTVRVQRVRHPPSQHGRNGVTEVVYERVGSRFATRPKRQIRVDHVDSRRGVFQPLEERVNQKPPSQRHPEKVRNHTTCRVEQRKLIEKKRSH